MQRKCQSIVTSILICIWALMIVCSDDVMVYANWNMEKVGQFSSFIVETDDLWTESNTDFVLQDAQFLKNKLRTQNHFSKIRFLQSVLVNERILLDFIQNKKYIFPREIEQFLNEKIVIEYIHRQDGDK